MRYVATRLVIFSVFKQIYLTMIRSVLDYACQVWHSSLSGTQNDKLESIQRRALRVIYPDLSYARALTRSGLPTLFSHRENLSKAFFKDMLSPSHSLHHLLPAVHETPYDLRRRAPLPMIFGRSDRFRRTLVVHGLRHWQ